MITYEIDDQDIAVITINNPDESLNILSFEAFRQFAGAMDQLAGMEDPRPVGVVIISGKADNFIVGADIKAVCDAAHARGVKVKVIFENAYLTDDEKVIACKLSEEAGADWVKTSTGFAPGGATLEDLRLMRQNVSPKVQVKAAGGVRTLDAILPVVDAGCTRVGATATASILDDFEARQGGKSSLADYPESTAGY